MTVRVEPLTGANALELLPSLARLRIEVFREYPYLYDGDLAYEEQYLHSLAASKEAVIVSAMHDHRCVGAATGAPLSTQSAEVVAPFSDLGIPLGEVFYFGESVLLPEYRGQGIGHAFFDARENHARRLDGIRTCAFCAVIRPDDHPARPMQYRPHDPFWTKRGYSIIPDAITSFSWRELGDREETEHPMQFWGRSLES